MAELFKVNAPVRKPLFEGVQGENEARSIQFDITPWVDELGDGAVTATAKRSQDSQPYPVTVTKDGNVVTWKPTSTDTAFAGVGSFQLEYTVDDVLAKTCIWSTMVAPSLDPAGDPPDPYDNWLAEMREIAADAIQSADDAEDSAENAEAWAVGQRGGVDVPSTDPTYHNNSKYWAEQSLANQYGAYIVKSASGDIASFSDGADDVPMKSVNVTITPKQSGSGDPSPSNVRPITGTSTANITVAGVNLFDKSVAVDGKYINHLGVETTTSGKSHSAIISVKPNTTYYMSGFSGNGFYSVLGLDSDGNTIQSWYGGASKSAPFTATTPSNVHYVYLNFNSDQKDTVIFCESSVAVEFEPFAGHTTPVPLGQTVYGGDVDVTTGVMTIDRVMVDLATLTWSQMGGYIQTSDVASVIKAPATIYTRCDVIAEQYVASAWAGTVANGIGIDSNGDMAISGVTSASGKMVYPLKNPTTVQLTPTQVSTLLGTNNVWADCGSVEVEYRADPTLAYNELANVIVSLGGNI